MSLFDIYNGVLDSIEEKKPELITLLEEHIDFDRLIPCEFTSAFCGRMGRKHIYHLKSILRALILQYIVCQSYNLNQQEAEYSFVRPY